MNSLKKEISTKAFITATVAAFLICLIFVGIGFLEYKKQKNTPPLIFTYHKIDYFSKYPIQAAAAVVYDVKENKILYAKNATTSMPLASITKVMTALVADQVLQKDAVIAIDQSSLDIEGESGFKPNQSWKFSDLLNLTLLTSSNDGAHAIANAAAVAQSISFPQKMNSTAKELGLNSMNFNNESGLDIDNSPLSGGYGSAEDVAKLFAYIIKNNSGVLDITKNDSWNFKSLDNTLYSENNTDLVVNEIPGILASKTGFTDMAGGNLAVAYDAGLNHPIVIVVLNSSWDGRFTDVLTLASSTKKTLTAIKY